MSAIAERLRQGYTRMGHVPSIKVVKEWKSTYGELGVYMIEETYPYVATLAHDGTFWHDKQAGVNATLRMAEAIAAFAGAEEV